MAFSPNGTDHKALETFVAMIRCAHKEDRLTREKAVDIRARAMTTAVQDQQAELRALIRRTTPSRTGGQ